MTGSFQLPRDGALPAALEPTRPELRPAWRTFCTQPFTVVMEPGGADWPMLRLGLKPLIRRDFKHGEAASVWVQRQQEDGFAAGVLRGGTGHIAFAASSDERLQEALDHEHDNARDDTWHRRMGELLAYPPCCVEAWVQRGGEGAVEAAAAASETSGDGFHPLLNQCSDRLFHYTPWQPCSYHCAASLPVLLELHRLLTGFTGRGQGPAALRLLSMPRLYASPQRQLLLDGEPSARGRLRYRALHSLCSIDRSQRWLSEEWRFFCGLAPALLRGDELKLEAGLLWIFRDGALIQELPLPKDLLLLPFSVDEQLRSAAPADRRGRSTGPPRGSRLALPESSGHRAQDLREARSVTTRGGRAQLEIQLGHLCNNRCVFCVSGQLTQERLAPPIPEAPVVLALEQAAARGCKKVTFLGGEPTIQRSFLPVLDRALELGFAEITIFSNGVRGRQRRFLQQVLDRGDFTWRFSIQGGTKEAHDRVTQRPGSFEKLMDGLRWLRERGQDITANLCVNEHSYRSLPALPALLLDAGVRQLHVDVVRPSGAGRRSDRYLRSIMPRFSELAPRIDAMLRCFAERAPGYDVSVGNLPYCVLPEWAHRIHHGGELTWTVAADGGELGRVWNKYRFQRSDMAYGERCDRCVFVLQCRGVPEKYVELYGADELRPVLREQLLALDPSQRNFAVLVDPWVQPLLRGAPPRGWTFSRLFRDVRERAVELSLQHERGLARLRFTPPSGLEAGTRTPQRTLLDGPHFRLSLELDDDAGSVPSAAIKELLRWARATLGASMDDRITAALARVEAAAPFRGWMIKATERSADGARLCLRETDGDGELYLGLLPGLARTGPKLRLEITLSPGTEAAAARPAVEQIIALLRLRGGGSGIADPAIELR